MSYFFALYIDGNFIISMPLWNKENYDLFYILYDGGEDNNHDSNSYYVPDTIINASHFLMHISS